MTFNLSLLAGAFFILLLLANETLRMFRPASRKTIIFLMVAVGCAAFCVGLLIAFTTQHQ